jgi:hypothetical protein
MREERAKEILLRKLGFSSEEIANMPEDLARIYLRVFRKDAPGRRPGKTYGVRKIDNGHRDETLAQDPGERFRPEMP